uniref:Uncharacterized protein n=1 Tax=Glossina pallidipes TaxID=7398 RepID=A0A1A9ZS61_GLOPL
MVKSQLKAMVERQFMFLVFGGIICYGFSGSVRLIKRDRYVARQEIATNDVTPYPLANDLKPEIQFGDVEPQDDRFIGDSHTNTINNDSKPDVVYGHPEITVVYGPSETDAKQSFQPSDVTLARHKAGQTRSTQSTRRLIYRQITIPHLRLV